MASVTLGPHAKFPAGTVLSVYAGSAVFQQPSGNPVASGTVGSDSMVTITGLDADTVYTAGARISGSWTAVRFRTAASVGSVQDATTSVKGIVRLAGDLDGTADAPTVPALAGKLVAASNLLDLTNVGSARSNLGLGSAATLNAPASGDAASGEVVKGGDSRLTDARTPVTHTHDDRYYTEAEVNALIAGVSGGGSASVIRATAGRNIASGDIGNVVSAAIDSGGSGAFTVPAHASLPVAVGSATEVSYDGKVQPSVAPASGVALVSESSMRKVAARRRSATLIKNGVPVTVLATKPTAVSASPGANPAIALNFGTLAVGDVVTAGFILTDPSAQPSLTLPDGSWVLIDSQQVGSAVNTMLFVVKKIVTVAGALNQSFATVMTTGGQYNAGGVTVRDAFGYVEASAKGNNGGVGVLNVPVPAVAGTGAALAMAWVASSNGTSFAPPAGYTEQFDVRSGTTDANRVLELSTLAVVDGASSTTATDALTSDVNAATGVGAIHVLLAGGDEWRLDGALAA